MRINLTILRGFPIWYNRKIIKKFSHMGRKYITNLNSKKSISTYSMLNCLMKFGTQYPFKEKYKHLKKRNEMGTMAHKKDTGTVIGDTDNIYRQMIL